MIELRTLGLLDLKAADGRELLPVLAQPKRLALLIYIAEASPRRFHRRDSLLALFWPKLDHEHGRAALRQAVAFLRRYLGEGVLVSRVEEELAVDEAALWCDATAFERACEEGEWEEALGLYRGDFLQGFFVAGAAPELEYWAENERARLRRRAIEASWALAECRRAAGDRATAGHWGRHAASLAPDDEGELQRLVALLDRLGDRSAALSAYEGFARRLAQDFEIEPCPETQALIEAIRAGLARPSEAAIESGHRLAGE